MVDGVDTAGVVEAADDVEVLQSVRVRDIGKSWWVLLECTVWCRTLCGLWPRLSSLLGVVWNAKLTVPCGTLVCDKDG